MSGITEGGGREMDGNTGRGGEDRRRGVHTLLSIEFLVKNGLSTALQARQQSLHIPKHRPEYTNH